MLLIASLLASVALLLPQDEAPTAPTGTSATVRSFLEQAEAALYKPTDDGLKSIAFGVPVTFPRDQLNEMLARGGQKLPEGTPEILRLAQTNVSWEPSGGPQVAGALSDDFPSALNMMRQQVQASLGGMGHQVLLAALNRTVEFGPLLENFEAAFDGAEGDDLRVLFTRKPGSVDASIPADSIVWLFDQEDNLPVGTLMSFDQQGPMGQSMKVTLNTRYEWKTARDDSSPLILAAMSATNTFGSFATMKQRMVYSHEERDGIIVLTGFSETVSQKSPMGDSPDVTKQVQLEGLVVNSASGS